MPDAPASIPATAVADELLRLTSKVLTTFEDDLAEFETEQEDKRGALRQLVERDRAAVTRATERLNELYSASRAIADNKGRRDVLEGILRQTFEVDTNRTFDEVDAELGNELKLARGITGAMRVPDIGRLLNQAAVQVDHLEDRANALEERLREATSLDAARSPARVSFDQAMDRLRRDLAAFDETLPLTARAWDESGWSTWTAPTEPTRFIRFGRFTHERLDEAAIPALLELPGDAGILIEPARKRDEAIEAARSIVLRSIAAFPPGSATWTFVDPKGLGESVTPFLPLTAGHPELIDGVLTREDEIEQKLASLNDLVEDRLRDGVARSDGPYRFVVLFDHPAGLNSRSISLVKILTETGPQAGLYTIVVKDPKPGKYPRDGRTLPALRTIKATKDAFETEAADRKWTIALDGMPDEAVLASLADTITRPVAPSTSEPVDLVDARSWWSANSTDQLIVRVGSTAAADSVTFDRSTFAVLAFGQRGSGVSTFLHQAVMSMATQYSPTDLQLFLVGLGESHDLEPYAQRRLPHARLVAVEADRELAASVLETAAAEITRRLVLFQAADVQKDAYVAYRHATGNDLPRFVLTIDRALELFSHRDLLSRKTGELLKRVALDGPQAGVHLLLTDNVENTAGTLLEALPQGGLCCVVLPCADTDARAVFGDNVSDIDLPREPGDAVVASGDGSVRRVRFAPIDLPERTDSLRMLRARAEADTVTREPRVVDGRVGARLERAPLDLLRSRDRQPTGARITRAWLGEPPALGSPVELQLTRDEGANLLVIADDPMIGQGLLMSVMTTAALDGDGSIDLHVIDFMGLETGFGQGALALEPAASVSVARRRNSGAAIESTRNLIVNRLAKNDQSAPTHLLVLNGLEQAHDLQVGTVRSSGDTDPLPHLEQIVRDGPRVGVHTVLWARSRTTLEERLTRGVARHFGLRVVGPMDAESSNALIDTPRASDLRPTQALLYDEPHSRLERFRPYVLADPSWVASVAAASVVNLTTAPVPTPTDLR